MDGKIISFIIKGLSYYAIAQILECDYATVRKYAERKHSNTKIVDDPVKRLKVIKELEWTNLLKEHSNLTIKQLRKLAPALYAWHYRNNRQWPNDNSPKAHSKP